MRKLSNTIRYRRPGRWHAAALLLTMLISFSPTALSQEGKSGAAPQDGPTNITFAHLFKEGELRLSQIDSSKVAPMPNGYLPYRNEGFKVETDAITSGPNLIDFAVPSVSDQGLFERLRMALS